MGRRISVRKDSSKFRTLEALKLSPDLFTIFTILIIVRHITPVTFCSDKYSTIRERMPEDNLESVSAEHSGWEFGKVDGGPDHESIRYHRAVKVKHVSGNLCGMCLTEPCPPLSPPRTS